MLHRIPAAEPSSWPGIKLDNFRDTGKDVSYFVRIKCIVIQHHQYLKSYRFLQTSSFKRNFAYAALIRYLL